MLTHASVRVRTHRLLRMRARMHAHAVLHARARTQAHTHPHPHPHSHPHPHPHTARARAHTHAHARTHTQPHSRARSCAHARARPHAQVAQLEQHVRSLQSELTAHRSADLGPAGDGDGGGGALRTETRRLARENEALAEERLALQAQLHGAVRAPLHPRPVAHPQGCGRVWPCASSYGAVAGERVGGGSRDAARRAA
jgi:hypothetical protein